MNEKDTKKIVQQSLIKTSGTFTDELMHKIEQQEQRAPVKINWWPTLAACLAIALLGIFLSQLSLKNDLFTGFQNRLFQILLSLFLIFSFYGLAGLKKKMQLLK